MALPNNALSTAPVPAALLTPDDRLRSSLLPATLLEDYDYGGVAVNDASQGVLVQPWRAYLSGSTIYYVPEAGGTPTSVLTDTDITELSFAFTQGMKITVAYVAAGTTKLYWYNPATLNFTTTTFAGVASPFLTLDDKRPQALTTADVLFFYVRSGVLYYRQQRDSYATERSLFTLPVGVTRIVNAGMGENYRVQIQLETL